MDIDSATDASFLLELYNTTDGNTETQVSMYEVGAGLGLEKNEAGAIAENLIIEGWAELVSLSGGVSITEGGIAQLQKNGLVARSAVSTITLGQGIVVDDAGQQALETLIEKIKNEVGKHQTPYEKLEEVVIDLKTLEIQMLSPSPKVAVIREVLRSLHSTIITLPMDELATEIDAMISS